MVTPPSAVQKETPGAKYYRYATWRCDEESPPDVFNEVTRETAHGYFSGPGENFGFEPIPPKIFPSLEAATQFVEEKRAVWAKKRQANA